MEHHRSPAADELRIEFDLRAGDSQDFESWLADRLPLSVAQLRVGFIAFALVGLAVWYRYPRALDLAAPHLVIPTVFGWLGTTALQAVNRLAARPYRRAPLMAEGTHVLRLLPSGLEHAGPRGSDTYPWSWFSEASLTRAHLFIRFRNTGTLIVPVSALKALGPGCEDSFLARVEALAARTSRP